MLDGYEREVLLALVRSTAGPLIGAHLAYAGTLDASVASPSEVFTFALLVNARSVLCGHSPSRTLEPSSAEAQGTHQFEARGESLTVLVVDSLVVGVDGRATSLAARGVIWLRRSARARSRRSGLRLEYVAMGSAATWFYPFREVPWG